MQEDIVRQLTVRQLTLLRNDAEHKMTSIMGKDNLPIGIEGKQKRLVLRRNNGKFRLDCTTARSGRDC